MSKQQLEIQLEKEQAIARIIANNPKEADFLKYLAAKNPDVSSDHLLILAADKNNSDEYFFKISYLKQAHSVNDTQASKIINAVGINHEVYNSFMHYVAVNDIPAHLVDGYITQCFSAKKSLGGVDKNGETPLQLAVKYGKVSTVLKFVEAGVGINQDNLDNGTTVLHYCVAYDKVDIITDLIGKCDFNVKDAGHAPAITQALVQGKGAIAEALAAGGTDLTLADINSGQTILHLLVGAKMFASAALAVQVGYDATIKDKAGVSPMDLIIDAIADGSCPFQAGGNLPALEMLEVFCDKKSVPLSKENIMKIELSSILGKGDILEAMHNYVKMAEEVNEFLADPNAPVLLQIHHDMEQLKLHLDEDQVAILEAAVKDTIQGSNVEQAHNDEVDDLFHIAGDIETESNTDLVGDINEELPQ